MGSWELTPSRIDNETVGCSQTEPGARSALTHACLIPVAALSPSCSIPAHSVLVKGIRPLDKAMPNHSYRKEEGYSRVRASSNVSILRGGVITLAEAESLEGRGAVLFPFIWVGEIHDIDTHVQAAGPVEPSASQNARGLASAWRWG